MVSNPYVEPEQLVTNELRHYAGAPAGTPAPSGTALPPRGRKRSANKMNTISAPAEGTYQIECQSCVTFSHSCAAAAASPHAGFGVAKRFTTAPDTNAPMK